MAHASYLRDKARQLRTERKLTLDEIAERLALSRSTIFYWIRDLPIERKRWNGSGWPDGARRKGTLAMQAKYRKIREEAYEQGCREFLELAIEPTFRDFVCLYIAEGYKRNRNTVALANSDPVVIKLATSWIRRFSRNPVKFSVQYHADQNLSELRAFWGQELDVEPAEIRLQRKSNSSQLKQRQWRCRYGVLSVWAGDTAFRARLQGWIDSINQLWLDSLHGA